MMADATAILKGLGGNDNIIELEPCITRLRVDVRAAEKVDLEGLKAAGAYRVLVVGNAVQVVLGPSAEEVADQIKDQQ